MPCEFCNFTTRNSPFYEEVIINVKGGIRQDDIMSFKFFSAALENIMRRMEWEDVSVKVVTIINSAPQMTKCLLHQTSSRRNKYWSDSATLAEWITTEPEGDDVQVKRIHDASFTLNGASISESSSYVYLG
ncbi:unnamed protein product [Haemonchus placei]|uniref:START domain-containing protein n=1 Tax=Haemonchus placei TaxID=6290 RepID=A0A0N4WTD9_HAEPC|nr:unnamed protein product [Haemonchus placei]